MNIAKPRLLATVVFCALFPVNASQAQWSHTEIDPIVGHVGPMALDLDANGLPHVAYNDQNQYRIEHTSFDGTSWNHSIPVTRPGGLNPTFAGLAVASGSVPHITYTHSMFDGGNFRHGVKNGAIWSLATIWSSGSGGVQIDSLENPRVAFGSGGSAYYGIYDGVNWNVQLASTTISSVRSHVLNANDHAFISGRGSLGELMYAHYDGANWTTMTVDNSSGSPGFESWIDLDSLGRPNILYTRFDNVTSLHLLNMATLINNQWQIQTIESGALGHSAPRLKFDSNGLPRIAVTQNNTLETFLRYLTNDGTQWRKFIVTDALTSGRSDFDLDGNDDPHFAYYGGASTTNGKLFYVTGSPPQQLQSFSIITGSLDSGGLPELFDSDDQYVVMDPAFGSFRYQLVYTVDATSPIESPGTLEFNYESKTFNIIGTVEQRIELFNYDTGQYETVDTRDTTPADSIVSVSPSGNPSRFVEVGTGAMRARISYQNSIAFWIFVFSAFFLPYETSVDQIFWNITP